MPHYRFYPVASNHIAGPPDVYECAADESAYSQAVACLLLFPAKRCDTVEIWDGSRLVGRVSRDDVQPAADFSVENS